MLLGHDEDDDIDDDDEDEDYEPSEDGNYEQDHQLDAEDALEAAEDEAMEELEEQELSPRISIRELFRGMSTRLRIVDMTCVLIVCVAIGGHHLGGGLPLGRILSTLRSNPGVTNVAALFETEQDGEREEPRALRERAERAKRDWWKRPHTEPQEAGLNLLHSGEFGRIGPKTRARNLARLLRERSLSQKPMAKEDLCEVNLSWK